MPNIVVRPAEDRDQEALYVVRALTYNNGDPYLPEKRELSNPGVRKFVVEYEGQISATCDVLTLTANRGKGLLACGGVAAVAVLPELRRSGVGSAMMSWLVSHLREMETPLASLYAYREPFYRKFGYEVSGRRLKIVCPSNRLPKIEAHLPLRRLTPADWKQLVGCYAGFAENRSGLNNRTAQQWQRVLGENRQLTIYAAGDPVEGYAVVSHVSNFWSTDHISEIAWNTKLGYESVLSMFAGLAINKTALSWFEPSDGPFYDEHLDSGITVGLERPVMFRVNDVPAALRALKPQTSVSGEFVVSVIDNLVAENEGPWHVLFKDGVVEVEKTTSDWDFRLDVRQFAQAFLGEPSLQSLAQSGRIEIASSIGLESAIELLPAQAVYCMDFF